MNEKELIEYYNNLNTSEVNHDIFKEIDDEVLEDEPDYEEGMINKWTMDCYLGGHGELNHICTEGFIEAIGKDWFVVRVNNDKKDKIFIDGSVTEWREEFRYNTSKEIQDEWVKSILNDNSK